MTAQTILPANSVTGGFNVANSLRGDRGSSTYLSRTFATGDRDKWTWSAWVKKNSNGNVIALFSSWADNNNNSVLNFTDDDFIQYKDKAAGSTQAQLTTTRVFKDVSAWYHIVLTYDSGNGTAGNRIRLYINGLEETDFATDTMPDQNNDSTVNRNCAHYIGTDDTNSYYLDCYLAEVRFVDGSALDPTSFGEFDGDSPTIWKPINVSGLTNGTNGFYLEFKQSGTSQNSSGLGADTSGEDHHFAVTNFAATDQSTDTCTNNFATLNFNAGRNNPNAYYATFSKGNLKLVGNSSTNNGNGFSTMGFNTGKWYCEVKMVDADNSLFPCVGTIPEDLVFSGNDPSNSGQVGQVRADTVAYSPDGETSIAGTEASYGDTFTNNDIIGIAIDCDNGAVYFSKNGTFQASGNPASGSDRTNAAMTFTPSSKNYFFAGAVYKDTNTIEFNFGSPPYAISSGNADADGHGNFEYAVPSGYFALNTKNLAEYG